MIHQYFDPACRNVVTDISALSSLQSDRNHFATITLQESDILFRLGAHFGDLARYRSKGSDLRILEPDLEAEVKYFRPFPNSNSKNSMTWKQGVKKDLDRLDSAIAEGRKGRFALIIGWPTTVPWRRLAQLGIRSGQKPPVDPTKIVRLPFLGYTPNGNTSTVFVCYDTDHGEMTVQTDYGPLPMNWHVYGGKEDIINLVMLW